MAAVAAQQHPADLDAALDFACAPNTRNVSLPQGEPAVVDVDDDFADSPRASLNACRHIDACVTPAGMPVRAVVSSRTYGAVLHALALSLLAAAGGAPWVHSRNPKP